MRSKIQRVAEASCGLFVIDLQERFSGVIQNWDSTISCALRLIKFFRLLQAPLIVTEQYPKGLGTTVPSIRAALDKNTSFYSKTSFSSYGCSEIKDAVQQQSRTQWILCGIETHVCVQQTALDLLEMGNEVFLAVDAISSRNPIDRELGLKRMQEAGAILSTSEALIFEILKDARHPLFKQAIALVK